LSAYKFVEVYAVDRLVELLRKKASYPQEGADHFDYSRRFETGGFIDPDFLATFVQGYIKIRQSAAAMLSYGDKNFVINQKRNTGINPRPRPSRLKSPNAI